MTTAIYARQSRDATGDAAAVGRQLEACRALAITLTLTDVIELVDNDVSATSGARPGFEALVGAVRAGSVTQILCWHPDRLYRRVRDLVEIMELAERHPITVHTVMAGDLDLTTASGRMLAGMLGHAARFEIEQKVTRQRAANEQRAKAGQWQLTTRPFGYRLVKGKPKILEAEAAIVRELTRRYIDGELVASLLRDLDSRGIRTARGFSWTSASLMKYMENPFHAGVRVYRGEAVAVGKWEPILDDETWTAFKAARALRRLSPSRPRIYLLSGILRCGVCGARATGAPNYGNKRADGTRKSRPTYICANACTTRLASRVDALITSRFLDHVHNTNTLTAIADRANLGPLVQEGIRLRTRRDELAALLADGLLTAAAVRAEAVRIRARLQTMDWQARVADDNYQPSSLPTGEQPLEPWWEELETKQQRAMIGAVMSITLLPSRVRREFDPDEILIEWHELPGHVSEPE